MEDVVIVGAGIVGLATARALQERRPGVGVTVLEKADDVATAQTGHNSGVIHAGLYYAPGSLKARLCRPGEAATKRFCADHGIAFRTPGKLVVATNDVEVERLRALGERAASNGIRLRRDGTSVTLDSFVQGDLLDPEVDAFSYATSGSGLKYRLFEPAPGRKHQQRAHGASGSSRPRRSRAC